jgi:O-antigen/teichoic acid export membrane protein
LKRTLYKFSPKFLKSMWVKLKSSPVGYRIATGSFWSLIAIATARGGTVISLMVASQILGQEEFGKLGMVQSTVMMFGAFAGFGLSGTAVKFLSQYRHSDPLKTGRILSLIIISSYASVGITACLLFFGSDYLAANVLKSAELSIELKISSILLFFTALYFLFVGILTGFEQYKTSAKINTLTGALTLMTVPSGTYLFGLRGAIIGIIIVQFIGFILCKISVERISKRNNITLSHKGFMVESSILYSFSLPTLLQLSVVGVANWGCFAILANSPTSYNGVGIFYAANQFFIALMYIPQIVSRSILPMLSKDIAFNNHSNIIKTLKISTKMVLIFTIPITLIIILFSKQIMAFYGVDFSGYWFVLVITASTAIVTNVQMVFGNLIIASGKIWEAFFMNLGWSILFFLGSFLLSEYGAAGIASARLLSYIVHGIWTIAFSFWIISKKKW